MDWNFSIGWFILGLMIMIGGTLTVVFYRQIAENMASGVSSYDKVKLFGGIAIGLGLIIMMNIHTFLLTLFVNLVFKR